MNRAKTWEMQFNAKKCNILEMEKIVISKNNMVPSQEKACVEIRKKIKRNANAQALYITTR